MLDAVIRAALETYNFKTNEIIFIRSSYKDNKDLEDLLQNYNLGTYDICFIDDRYFGNQNENVYAIIVDKRMFQDLVDWEWK